MKQDSKIIISGGAGLLGQNLIYLLSESGFTNLWAIDKNAKNLAILKKLNPRVNIIESDLAQNGPWMEAFNGADCLFLLQARITADSWAPFEHDTLLSTQQVIKAASKAEIPFTVFTGSSVVHSVADDNYTRSKKKQELMFIESGLPGCVVRPTLMFGWFDPKHLGWLSRFMAKTPIFPIPGHGRYLRQPLYVRDFCRVLLWCAENKPIGASYDIVGQEEIYYVDIIKTIKKTLKLKTLVLPIPVPLFRLLLKGYAILSKNPPFVADQLDALMAGDYFVGENLKQTFDFDATTFAKAIEETFTHPINSSITLERTL